MQTSQSSRLLAFLTLLSVVACGGSDGASGVVVPTTGTLHLTTATGGTDPDLDGYALLVDQLPSLPIGSNTTLDVQVPPGSYLVLLTGIAANCILTVPDTVTVTAGATVAVNLGVNCTPILTNLRVSAQSTGQDPAPGGYQILVDGAPAGVVPPNGDTVVRIPHGQRVVQLSAIASNCTLSSAPQVTVQAPIGQTTGASFSLACVHTPKVAFMRQDVLLRIFTMNPDGTGLFRVSPGSMNTIYPEWAPDGQRLLFLSTEQDLYIANADGGHPHMVPLGATKVLRAAWSPDGAHLVLAVKESATSASLFIADTSGANRTRISSSDGAVDTDPAWSPDGTRIAFVRDSSSYRHLFVAMADGSGVTQITSEVDDRAPAWSPAGTRLAFSGQGPTGERRIYLVNPDGTNRASLQDLDERIWGEWSRWSAGGTVIVSDGERLYQVDVVTGQELSSRAEATAFIAWRN